MARRDVPRREAKKAKKKEDKKAAVVPTIANSAEVAVVSKRKKTEREG